MRADLKNKRNIEPIDEIDKCFFQASADSLSLFYCFGASCARADLKNKRNIEPIDEIDKCFFQASADSLSLFPRLVGERGLQQFRLCAQ